MSGIISSIIVAAATSYITSCFSRTQLLAEYKLMFSDHVNKAQYDVQLEIFRELSSVVIGTIDKAIQYSRSDAHSGDERRQFHSILADARNCLTANIAFIEADIYDSLYDLIETAEALENNTSIVTETLIEKRALAVESMRDYFLKLGKG